MSTRDKLIQRFLEQPQTIGVREIVQLLQELGYEERRNAGSHRVFHKKGCSLICIPTEGGRKVKTMYVRRLAQTLNLEDYVEHQEGD
ncbi:MAG: type II toxin-antitoxin system HicA family toxin [Dehalococcoidia bacterium]|nr:type II toxin-antitoxin system HicA family toxin [Dehalococcoidia bacterium]